MSSPTRSGDPGAAVPAAPALERKIGPLQATAINMTQMCGIGPFVTIPLVVAAMGGPQAMFGWLIGALIAVCDGLVWAELGSAMPGAGGSYIYLREAFQYRTGRMMPFMFVWSAVLFIPLIMSSGIIGLIDYLGYLWPAMVDGGNPSTLGKIVGIVLVLIITLGLFRKIGELGKFTTVLFVVMLFAALAVIVAAFSNFSASQAFAFTPGAFSFPNGAFFAGLGIGLINAVYDYLGYNTIAYLGGEVRNPGKTMPRAIVYSILGIMGIYFLLQVGVLGSLPLDQVKTATSVASSVVEASWGTGMAKVLTVLIIIAAVGSVFAGLLGGSRVPYEAARDRVFLKAFGKLHPKLNMPTLGVITMGFLTAVFSLFSLGDVIAAALTTLILLQSLAQCAAIIVLRRRQPGLKRPYKQWLYPVPTILAIIGWVYIFVTSDPFPKWVAGGWCVFGLLAFLVYAAAEKTWPFGPKEIREAFLDNGEEATRVEGAQA